jgi:DNA-binding NarL/FixJ family response regulator
VSADAVEPDQGGCPVCDGTPRVLVAVRHPVMRRFTLELVRRDHQCWIATEPEEQELLVDAIRRLDPDVLVVDDGDFPACCRAAIAAFPRSRVVVVGTEPDRAYEAAAFRAGAGAWVPRERVGEDLGPVMRAVLGCRHAPCPPATERVEAATVRGSTGS